MRTCLIAFCLISLAAPAFAQDAAQTAPAPPRQTSNSPDFLFGRPAGSVAIRGSWLLARGSSDWYSFVTDQLTLNRRDFNAPGIVGEVAIALNDRLEAVAGVDYSRAGPSSEYRHFVDNNRQSINQDTDLRQANLTGGLKFSLANRGRGIGQFAWIPRTVTPYVGAGGGMLWYRLRQAGDFVDFVDLSVFTDAFESEGWAPTAHVLGGVDVKVARRLFVTFDARYRWAAATLSSQWVSFDPIDLSGLRLSAGINVPF